MSLDRRSFVTAAASLAAAAAVRPAGAFAMPADHDIGPDDPLGVRGDFPIIAGRTYLNSAYITPIPRQVVAVAQAFAADKSTRPLLVNELLARNNAVRIQFAKLVNASPD